MIKNRRSEFKNPGNEFRGKPFWAWNGKLEEQELLRQIDILDEMGFGGYFMHSRTGLETEYLGEEWFQLINVCTDYGAKKEMENWLYDEDRWPSGSAGGLVTKEKEYCAMYLDMLTFTKESIRDFEWKMESPPHLRSAEGDEVIKAYVCRLEGASFTELREYDTAGELNDGETVLVFRTKYAQCKDSYNGYSYLDTMNPKAVERFIELTHEKYVSYCGDRVGKEIKGVFTDEPARGSLFSVYAEGSEHSVAYTPGLFEKFEEKFGYSLREKLPELFLLPGDLKIVKVKHDYIELCQQLFLDAYAKTIHTWCEEHNMIFTGHVIQEDNLTGQALLQGSLMRFYEHMDYPGIDILGAPECWWAAKQLVSAARQTGKKTLLSEMYACTGWNTDFNTYKQIGDWQAFYGINLRCPHLSWYTMKGEAKRDYPASILHQSTWYQEYHYVEDYFSRIHAAMQGEPQCNLLVLNPVESVWARLYSGSIVWIFSKDPEVCRLEELYVKTFHQLQEAGIDFDYGDEDMMKRLGIAENGILKIGEAAYKKVLVSGADVIRSSTLKLLKKFKDQGGEVIFAGEVPVYLDCEYSNEIMEFAKECICVPFDKMALACASGEEITIEAGQKHHIYSQVRINGDEKTVMLLNMDRENSVEQATIGFGKGVSLEQWNVRTGEINPVDTEQEEGCLYLTTNFAAGEERIYVVRQQRGKKQLINNYKEEKIEISDTFSYTLSEPNIYVMDMVTIQLEDGKEICRQEVLKADKALRDNLGLSHRGGMMIQPWYEHYQMGVKQQKECDIHLTYTLETEIRLKEVCLAVEDLEHIREITINGAGVELISRGEWVDICFSIIEIPEQLWKIGENEIRITYEYYKSCGLETIYLLGDFGVYLKDNGKTAVIKELPAQLGIGDITSNGLPFYSGKLSYQLELEEGNYEIELPGFGGACINLIGKKTDIVAYPPYKEIVEDLKEIQVVLTRKNTFGPLHVAMAYPDMEGDFCTEGNQWSEAYRFIPAGLLKKPSIKRYK